MQFKSMLPLPEAQRGRVPAHLEAPRLLVLGRAITNVGQYRQIFWLWAVLTISHSSEILRFCVAVCLDSVLVTWSMPYFLQQVFGQMSAAFSTFSLQ